MLPRPAAQRRPQQRAKRPGLQQARPEGAHKAGISPGPQGVAGQERQRRAGGGTHVRGVREAGVVFDLEHGRRGGMSGRAEAAAAGRSRKARERRSAGEGVGGAASRQGVHASSKARSPNLHTLPPLALAQTSTLHNWLPHAFHDAFPSPPKPRAPPKNTPLIVQVPICHGPPPRRTTAPPPAAPPPCFPPSPLPHQQQTPPTSTSASSDRTTLPPGASIMNLAQASLAASVASVADTQWQARPRSTGPSLMMRQSRPSLPSSMT